MTAQPRTIWTVGHSTHSAEQLLDVLAQASIRAVADVRRFPGSRRHPQFNSGVLATTLAAAGIDYVLFGDSLGGRRGEQIPAERSENTAWKIAAFRHYADAMLVDESLAQGIGKLEALATTHATAIMCAEVLWWRCHRRLIADLLTVRGWQVVHLMGTGKVAEHTLSEWARVIDGRLTYPALV